MKNLTFAIFLTLLFYTVSGNSEEAAEGFRQNPEYSIPGSASSEKNENIPVTPTEKADPNGRETNNAAQNANRNNKTPVTSSDRSFQRRTGTSANNESSYRRQEDSELKDWEQRNSPVPTSLPRVTNFRPRASRSSSRTYRSSSRTRVYSSCSSCSSSSSRIRVYRSGSNRKTIRVSGYQSSCRCR